MGGGIRRGGILAWTGSVSSRSSSSSMARVGGEHLGRESGRWALGVWCTLFCLIGHATTRTAAAGAHSQAPVRGGVRLSVPRLLALPALLSLPASLGNDAGGSVGEKGGGEAATGRGGSEDADARRARAFAGLGGATLRFGTRPNRCTQAPVLPVLKASISLICGALVR